MRMPILRTGNYESDRRAWLEALLEAENPSTKVSKAVPTSTRAERQAALDRITRGGVADEPKCHLRAFSSIAKARKAGETLLRYIERAQSGAIDAAGGFTVATEWEDAIADTRDAIKVARGLAQTVPMTTDMLQYPRFGSGVVTSFTGEGLSNSDVTSSADLIGLVPKKVMALIKVSTEVAADAALLADFVASSLGYALEQELDNCFFAGDGTSTYGGMTGVVNKVQPGGTVTATGHNTLATLTNDDIGALIAALPSAFHAGAVLAMHPKVWGLTCVRLAATAGAEMVDEANRRAFAGYRVVLAPAMPSATTSLTGLPIMVLADWQRSSMIGMRREVNIKITPHRFLDTDQLGILGSCRFDVVHHGCGDATTAGAAVMLVGG